MCEWRNYKKDGNDKKGRKIIAIYAHDTDHIIYQTDDGLHLEGNVESLDKDPEVNHYVSQIKALAPVNEAEKSLHFSQLATALSSCVGGDITGCKMQLKRIFESLQNKRNAVARLIYLWAAVGFAASVWIIVLFISNTNGSNWWGLTWALAISFGATGGVLSVAWRQQQIPVDPDRSPKMHISNGMARIILAALSGLACFLAIKSGVILNLLQDQPKNYDVLFFCFLSGFSEKFMPNVLSNADQQK